MLNSDLRKYMHLDVLLKQLPHNGYVHENMPIHHFIKYEFDNLKADLFTGISFFESAVSKDVVFLNMGTIIYTSFCPLQNIEIHLRALPIEAKVSSIKLMRLTLKAGYSIIEGNLLNRWNFDNPQEIDRAINSFASESCGALVSLDPQPKMCAFYNKALMRSHIGIEELKGIVLQYQCLDDLHPVTHKILEPVVNQDIFNISTADVSKEELKRVLSIVEYMYNKKLGRSSMAIFNQLEDKLINLTLDDAIILIKNDLETRFGQKAVYYFSRKLEE